MGREGEGLEKREGKKFLLLLSIPSADGIVFVYFVCVSVFSLVETLTFGACRRAECLSECTHARGKGFIFTSRAY